jgi:tetratricopeptide (TPR) repeat protein
MKNAKKIKELEQNVWDERFFPLLVHKIDCLENALKKIVEFEKENGANAGLKEIKKIAKEKLSVYRIEIEKPFEIQLVNNEKALENEWDEAQKDLIRTRILGNYISMKNFDNAYTMAMELLAWHLDIWWQMNSLIEQKAIHGNRIKEVQDLYFEQLFKFKDNPYLWNSLAEVFNLDPENVSVDSIDRIFQQSESSEVEKENVPWNYIGIMYFEKQAFKKAVKLYLKAVEVLNRNEEDYSKSLVIYYGNISEAYLMLGQFEDALSFAEKGIELDPDNVTLIEYKLKALNNNKS